jgi:hypothetical protein
MDIVVMGAGMIRHLLENALHHSGRFLLYREGFVLEGGSRYVSQRRQCASFQIIGILGVLYSIWIAIKQLKLQSIQRRDLAIMECARSFEDREFTEAYALLTGLHTGLSNDEFHALDDSYELAALRVCMKFETVGLLVYKNVIPLDAMEDLVGGAAISIYNILQNWIEASRLDRNHPTFLEWYQWLFDRLNERNRLDRPPAFKTFKNWKPRY